MRIYCAVTYVTGAKLKSATFLATLGYLALKV